MGSVYMTVEKPNLDEVKFCPFCGHDFLITPNDLYEWVCGKCKTHFQVK